MVKLGCHRLAAIGMSLATILIVSGLDQGTFSLKIDGKEHRHQIVTLSESHGLVTMLDPWTLKLGHGKYDNQTETTGGTRIWLSKDGLMNPDSYVQISLLGKSLQYTIDMRHLYGAPLTNQTRPSTP